MPIDVYDPEVLVHTGGDILYCQLVEGHEETFTRERATARVIYACEWPRRYDFLKSVLGYPAAPGDPWTPWPYPTLGNVEAMEARMTGSGASQIPGVPFDAAKIEVNYSNPPWDIENDVKSSIEYQGSVSLITLPQGTLYFDSDDVPYNVEGGLNVAQIGIALTRYRMSSLGSVKSTFDSLLGKTNSATFDDRPAGTVLFANYSTRTINNAFGTPDITVSCQLIYRQIGWNLAIRPGTGVIEGVHYDTGNRPYPQLSFAGLT